MNLYSEADWELVFDRYCKEVARKLVANDQTDTVVYETQELVVRVRVADAAMLELEAQIDHKEYAAIARTSPGRVPLAMNWFAKSTAMTLVAAQLPRAAQ